MAKNIRARGQRYERELAEHFTTRHGLSAHRTSLTQKFGGGGNCDLIGIPYLAVEAKYVEKLDFRGAYRQAKRNSAPGEIATVITRRNLEKTEDSLVVLDLSDFARLYEVFLLHHGHRRDDEVQPDTA